MERLDGEAEAPPGPEPPGSLFVSERPRWLLDRGCVREALEGLLAQPALAPADAQHRLVREARCHRLLGHKWKAIATLVGSLHLGEGLRDRLGVAAGWREWAWLALDMGRLELARSAVTISLELAAPYGSLAEDFLMVAAQLRAVAGDCHALHAFAAWRTTLESSPWAMPRLEALAAEASTGATPEVRARCWERAYRGYRMHNRPLQQHRVAVRWAADARSVGDLEAAQRRLEQAQAYCASAGLPGLEAAVATERAVGALERGQTAEARALTLEALDGAEASGALLLRTQAYLVLARIELELQRRDVARARATRALQRLDAIGAHGLVARWAPWLAGAGLSIKLGA